MEIRLFDPADPPEWLDPEWWRDRPHCDHLGSPTGAHVARLKAAADLAWKATFLADGGPACDWGVTDLGAGDGALLSLLPDWLRLASVGYDVIEADTAYARDVRDVMVLNSRGAIDPSDVYYSVSPVVVLTEVLEHMADPHGFLALLAARPEVHYVVASSPRNETPEQHEWNHAWAWDPDGYREMFVSAGFEAREFQPIEWSQLWLFERAA
jgi:hypothetical protein